MSMMALPAFAVTPAQEVIERPFAAALPTYTLAAAPTASFEWFPSFPRVGEPFTLVSTSSDLASPIVAFAWDTSDNGPFGEFKVGGPAASATFSTPADHVARLRVTSADHLSSIAARTIQMRQPATGILQPFPTVRISGRPLASGVKLNTLTVKAPPKALIKVTCRGHGCPTRAVTRVAVSSRGLAVAVAFRRFERFLPAGATLEIRVSKGASIGAYTRFSVRRRRLPLRVDSCLEPSGLRPIACPSV
jgi:hypothetical protein